MNFAQFKNEIKNRLRDVYVIKGEDEFLIDSAFNLIYDACEIAFADLDVSKFDIDNFSISSLLNSLEQLPFNAKKRLIALKNLKKVTEAEKKLLIEYVKNPSELSCLVIIAYKDYESFSFLENVGVVDCFKLDIKDLKTFILGELEKYNLKIEEDAILLLIEYTSSSLLKINSEIKKLSTAKLQDGIVKSGDIKKHVCADNEYQIYELTDAISRKKNDKVLSMIQSMLLKKEDPSGIISLLAAFFKRAFHVKISNLSDSELAKLLNVKEYAVKKVRESVGTFSAVNLKKINSTLIDAEFNIKSGKIPAEECLFNTVFEIMTILA